MTIAASMPRRAPDRPPWRSPLQADGHVDGRRGDQTPWTNPNRIGGFGARAILFGPFCLLPEQRLLLQADKPVSLGSRALDILIALVERRGDLVSKGELMARVWPDTLVVDSNLSVHIAALRRVLQDGHAGNRYMVNIPGRGYRFVAPVTFGTDAHSAAAAAPIGSTHNLPASQTRLMGRVEVIDDLAAQLPQWRLLTICGPGGIGKTAVALALAQRLVDAYEHGVWLIDLAQISNPRLLSDVFSAALGLKIDVGDPLPALDLALRDKRTLLVLDNCERVIGSAARLVASILRSASHVQILAISREPLRVEGERAYRLPPLASPPVPAQLTASEALGFPALQLFRSSDLSDGRSSSDES